MPHLEPWHICPTCKMQYEEYEKAVKCRNNHPIKAELWVVGKYQAIKLSGNSTVGEKEKAFLQADKFEERRE